MLSGLIWVQTVCKGYQQKTIVGRVNGRAMFYAILILGHTCDGKIMPHVKVEG